MERRTVVVGHHDVHGVVAAVLAARALDAEEVYANYPHTSPEQLPSTLRSLYGAAVARLRIVVVDVPVDARKPVEFVGALNGIAQRHELVYIDHHETSVPYLLRLNARTVYVGPSALALNNALLSLIPEPSDVDRTLAVVGAIADRDPEVVKRSLLTEELQLLSDGLDVLVREKDGALRVVRGLFSDPAPILEEARKKADQIPTAKLVYTLGPVVVAGRLPEHWSTKALERLAFRQGAWYAVGHEYASHQQQWVVRAIIRWDAAARLPQLPQPKTVAAELWPTRSILGHDAAPSVAAATEQEAVKMAEQLAKELAARTRRELLNLRKLLEHRSCW